MNDRRATDRAAAVRRLLGVILAVAAVAAVWTWPLATAPASGLVAGSETSPTVPLFNLWTLRWNARWWHGGGPLGTTGYWDAPIFYPARGAFAFSEPQPIAGLLAALLPSARPALAYNVVLWCWLMATGLAAWWLARALRAPPDLALAAAVTTEALPFLTHERGVLQLQAAFGPLLVLAALLRLLERGTRRDVLLLAAAVVVTFWTSEYYGLFLPFLLLGPLLAFGGRVPARRLGLAVAGLTLGVLVLVPFLGSQRAALRALGASRPTAQVEAASAHAADYLRASPTLRSSRWLALDVGSRPLSAGWLLSGAAVAGALLGWRDRRRRRHTLVWLAIAVAAGLGSLGPHLALAGWQPWETLRATVPGYAGLRSPFRLGLFVQIACVPLALEAWRRIATRSRRALVAIVGLTLLELLPRATPWFPVAPLRAQLPGPVAYLPYVTGSSARDYLDTVAIMNALLPAGAPLVNGYSGYFPPQNEQLKQLLRGFPDERSLRVLEALGVRVLLVDTASLAAPAQERLVPLAAAGRLQHRGGVLGLDSFELPGGRFRPVSAYDGSWGVDAAQNGRVLIVRAWPRELAGRVFVADPARAPLEWRLELRSDRGTRVLRRTVPGPLLLAEGSALRPAVTLRVAPGERVVGVIVRDARTGRRIGRAAPHR